MAERRPAPDRRLPGEPLRRHQHQGRRHLRVLRLQRVVRRRRRARRRSRQQLGDWITHTLAQKYNGKSAPRIVLFSPIAHEDLGNPDLAGRQARTTQRLALYTRAMARGRPGARAYASSICSRRAASCMPPRQAPLTIKGVHLNTEGNRRIARGHRPRAVRRAAGASGAVPRTRCARPWSTRTSTGSTGIASTDGYSTYGDRAFLTFVRGNPRNVNAATAGEDGQGGRPADQLRGAAARAAGPRRDDARIATGAIWAIARGSDPKSRCSKVDDSDTPPFDRREDERARQGPNGAHVFIDGEDAIVTR